jgi:hypothetical protein
VIETYAKSNRLFIDIDERHAPHLRSLCVAFRLIGFVKPTWFSYVRTKHGWHVEIGLNRRLSAVQTVAYQAVLGSDPRRECLNLMRVMHGGGNDKRWNILYSRKLT